MKTKYLVEEEWFRGESRGALARVLNAHLDKMKPGFELVTVQELKRDSRANTANSFEFMSLYLIVWRVK